jgi:translation initiation factor IF-3
VQLAYDGNALETLFSKFNTIKKLRVNLDIRVPRILLVDGEDKQEMTVEEGVQKAQAVGLDLVEVAPLATPPVCKIMDFKNYLYNLKKKEKKQRKSAKKTETKTVRLSVGIEQHDMETKARQARSFLEGRDLVKVVLIFHGREITHQDLGIEKLKKFFALLEDIAEMEQPPARQGYQMAMMLVPK